MSNTAHIQNKTAQEESALSQGALFFSTPEEKEKVSLWRNRLESALKIYQPYYEVIKRARRFYLGAQDEKHQGFFSDSLKSGASFFWSSIETQKPFLYFKQPKPYLERLSKYNLEAEQVAAKILERALEWNLKLFDFDSVINYARNDYLIFGTGILWESYEAEFETIELEELHETVEIKTNEKVVRR